MLAMKWRVALGEDADTSLRLRPLQCWSWVRSHTPHYGVINNVSDSFSVFGKRYRSGMEVANNRSMPTVV